MPGPARPKVLFPRASRRGYRDDRTRTDATLIDSARRTQQLALACWGHLVDPGGRPWWGSTPPPRPPPPPPPLLRRLCATTQTECPCGSRRRAAATRCSASALSYHVPWLWHHCYGYNISQSIRRPRETPPLRRPPLPRKHRAAAMMPRLQQRPQQRRRVPREANRITKSNWSRGHSRCGDGMRGDQMGTNRGILDHVESSGPSCEG